MAHGFPWEAKIFPALCAGALLCVCVAACSVDPVYVGSGVSAPDRDSDDDAAPEIFCDDARCFVDASVAPDSMEPFREATEKSQDGDSGRSEEPEPAWVYPLADSVHPNNLGLLSFHFLRATPDQTTFEVSLTDGVETRRMFIPCPSIGGNGCVYNVPEEFWVDSATIFAGQTVQLGLRALGAEGVSEETRLDVAFSPEPVMGGLYYWSAELRGLFRLAFGGRRAVPYIAPGSDENPEDCAGCHSVSRDGGTIALVHGSASADAAVFENAAFTGGLRVARVTSPETPLVEPNQQSDGGMMALSSNGSRVVSAFNYKLTLGDTKTGELLDEVEIFDGRRAFFPEFSPDNSRIVVSLTSRLDTEIAVRGGAIAMISVEGDRFGEVQELVPEREGIAQYYPTWSPDGNWVAFVSGLGGEADELKSYDQKGSHLRLVSVKTKRVFDLDAASGPANSTSTWPKFAPFEQCPIEREDCDDAEKLFFLSYSSKRAYGLVVNVDGLDNRAQLWMSAISIPRTEEGKDPSLPPFWVPYQSPDTRNHLGYWTEALRCNEAYPCNPGHYCQEGTCMVVVR